MKAPPTVTDIREVLFGKVAAAAGEVARKYRHAAAGCPKLASPAPSRRSRPATAQPIPSPRSSAIEAEVADE